jgi:hypothetical protein
MISTSRVFDISAIVDQKYQQQVDTINFAKQQIVILDDAKEPYKAALTGIDASLYRDIKEVNNTIVAVGSAYQDRIDAGCRSDLFWAQTGFTTNPVDTWTYTCTAISYVGYGTTAFLPVGFGSTAIPAQYGYETDNFHGIKQYNEPYFEDLLDTYVGSGIGTIGVGTTELFILAPIATSGIEGLEVGQLVQSSKPLVFSGNVNTIVGIATTVKDLSGIEELGITTNKSVINVLTLKDQSIGNAKAPEDDNSYVTFTVLISPDDLPDDYAIPFGSGAYTPQTVSMMNQDSVGSATSIEYVNNGSPNVSVQWNKFLNGFPNPDDLEETVSPPNVGAGVQHYRIGFTSAPTVSGFIATEGQVVSTTIQIGQISSPVGFVTLSTCPSQEAALAQAISDRDAKESEFSSGISTFNNKLNLTNSIREDLSELNLRIWAYRMQIGKAQENQIKYDNFKGLINSTENKDLIDNV